MLTSCSVLVAKTSRLIKRSGWIRSWTSTRKCPRSQRNWTTWRTNWTRPSPISICRPSGRRVTIFWRKVFSLCHISQRVHFWKPGATSVVERFWRRLYQLHRVSVAGEILQLFLQIPLSVVHSLHDQASSFQLIQKFVSPFSASCSNKGFEGTCTELCYTIE